MPTMKRITILFWLGFGASICVAIALRARYVALSAVTPLAKFRVEGSGDIIGIDLGRAYSRVGVFRNDTFESIVDEHGHSQIPCYVAFTDQGSPLVGVAARDQLVNNPKNTIYDLRHLIGRKFPDPELQDTIKELTYGVVEKNGKPRIKVQIKGTDQYLTPEEILSKIIEKLKDMAEAHLNERVEHAIIAVPTYFNDMQRQAIKDAAAIAGLNILRFVNEPTAVGMAYGVDMPRYNKGSKLCEECYFVIYNLDTKESHLALESVDEGVFEVLASASDRSLGGKDFENALLDHVITQFNDENNIDVSKNLDAMKRLTSEVEKAEIILATGETSTKLELQTRAGINEFSMTLTQSQLLELNKILCERALVLVKQLLLDAKIKKGKVHGLIITGDPAHIAKVQPCLEAYLDGKNALSSDKVRPDQAIVHGAAIQGYYLSSYDDELCGGPIMDVTRLGLGIATIGDRFTKLILRNTVIPTHKMRKFSTVADNQEKVVIRVFEGERAFASKNQLRGTLELKRLPRRPKGTLEIEVVFEMDPDQVLTVIAREKSSRQEVKLIIGNNENPYGWEEIDAIVADAETHYEEEELLLMERPIETHLDNAEYRFGVAAI